MLLRSQKEGVGPGDLSSNIQGTYVEDVTFLAHFLVCILMGKEMVSPSSDQDPGHSTDLG